MDSSINSNRMSREAGVNPASIGGLLNIFRCVLRLTMVRRFFYATEW